MLFLFLHLLSAKAGAIPWGHPFVSRASADVYDDINSCRRRFDIVLGCFTTIFACTWVSTHPNVPSSTPIRPPESTPLWRKMTWKPVRALWRKLKLMLITLLAPELMVGFATRQFFATEFDLSLTHSYFISMGRFVTHPIVYKDQVKRYLEAIKAVSEDAIEDKSKGDAFSKGVALLQGLWFITQCLTRTPFDGAGSYYPRFRHRQYFYVGLCCRKPFNVEDPITSVEKSDGPEETQPLIADAATSAAHGISNITTDPEALEKTSRSTMNKARCVLETGDYEQGTKIFGWLIGSQVRAVILVWDINIR
ncbi:hypothetical protein B0H19DRAFT_930173 [Mycena capillaripes]|nr:hypothetical protein B0H19DRAFT_930173 [Mycena capillaripes]